MSAKYLLPCHDGNAVEVTTADAGRMIDCPCGKKVQVPTLRGIQSLPRASQPDGAPTAPTWSAQQGAIFTIGLCLLVVGLIALGLLFRVFRQIDTTKPDMNQAALAEFELAAESAEAANTLEVWHALRNSPLGAERGDTYWEVSRAVAREYLLYLSIAGGIAAIGLAMAVAGPLMRPKVAARRGSASQKCDHRSDRWPR